MKKETQTRRSFLKNLASLAGLVAVPGFLVALSPEEERRLAKKVVKSGQPGVLTYCEANYCSQVWCFEGYSQHCPAGYCRATYCASNYSY